MTKFQTPDHFFIPPSIVRAMPDRLKDDALTFEAVYAVSSNGLVAEAWPGTPNDQGPCTLGATIVNPFSNATEI